MASTIAPPAGEPLTSEAAEVAVKQTKDRITAADALKRKQQEMQDKPKTANTNRIVKRPHMPMRPAYASRDKRISSLRLPIREYVRVPQPQAVDKLFRTTNDRSRTILYRMIFG